MTDCQHNLIEEPLPKHGQTRWRCTQCSKVSAWVDIKTKSVVGIQCWLEQHKEPIWTLELNDVSDRFLHA